jgi:hypothetical protein
MGDHSIGHLLTIKKALYELRTSGARWHDIFSDCHRDMGFFPCKAEPDIWMRRNGERYENVAVHVDDLAMALVDSKNFVSDLETNYGFTFKGTVPILFHLRMDICCENNGTL